MRLKYKLGLGIVVVALVVCFMTYQSYALWIVNHEGEQNVVEVGCFTVSYEEISESISLKNTYPISDAKGLSTEAYSFKVKNTCSVDSKYVVTLNTLTTNTLGKENIKFAIYKEGEEKPTTGQNLGAYGNINTDIKELNVENLAESIILKEGNLKQEEEATYHLYLWMDEATGNEGMNKSFVSSVNVISRATTYEAPKAGVDTIIDLASTSEEIVDDETVDHNLRYIGANPNNYVRFNGELWRIIGVMNNMKTNESDAGESRLKLIRAEAIGSYSWDTTPSGTNSGLGYNDWSDADAMKLLNEGYENESVGGSLYWNASSGTCYNSGGNGTTSCDFTSIGLKDKISKNMIAETLWNLGGASSYESTSNGLASHWYSYERGTTVYNGRPTTWKGKIALMYPSDYGYATSGGSTTNREACLQKELNNWNDSNVSDCKNNDWLFNFTGYSWTLSQGSVHNFGTIAVLPEGGLENIYVYHVYDIFPTLYLKNEVKIVSGDGSVGNPFELSL